MKMLGTALVSVLSLSSLSAKADFLPKNNLHLQDRLHFNAGITQAEFIASIAEVEAEFKNVVKSHNGNLKMNLKWSDSTVNASANQSGSTWEVTMYGGLARRPEITRDGFTLVICHELGHHMAGYAFYQGDDWASNEGQSDYFATQACARRLWKNKAADNARLGANAPSSAKANCNQVYTSEADRNMCYRIANASISISKLLATLGGERAPKPENPDTRVVRRTVDDHPEAQCRLDTYLRGSYCRREFNFSVIPGKNNEVDMNGASAEVEAFEYSCSVSNSSKLEARPSCWFKAQTE